MPTATRFTLRNAVTAIKLAVTPIASWPLAVETKTTVFLMYNIFWCFSIIHLIVTATALIYTILLNRNDLELVIKISSELFGISSAVMKMIISKSQTSRIQILVAEMEMFLKNATSKELELLQFYVDKLVTFHGTIYVVSFVGPMSCLAEPAISSESLPLTVSYPFSIEPSWIYVTMWISQTIILFQVGSMLVLNMMYAMLLWYTGARFEMLCTQFQNAKNENDIRRCIQNHQELLNYSSKLRASVRNMAVIVFGIAIMAATTGGFILTQHPPPYVLAKYAFFELGAGVQVFIYAWPADNLMGMGIKVGYSAYASAWIGKTLQMQKNIRIVIQRSDIPLTISITGLLPILSLELAATCVTACFSYITTLHAFAG